MAESHGSGSNNQNSHHIVGTPWIALQLGLSERQARRLAVQRKLAGVFRSQKGGRWKVNKVQFSDWIEGRKIKA
jgi:Helix-turn-helix domain